MCLFLKDAIKTVGVEREKRNKRKIKRNQMQGENGTK